MCMAKLNCVWLVIVSTEDLFRFGCPSLIHVTVAFIVRSIAFWGNYDSTLGSILFSGDIEHRSRVVAVGAPWMPASRTRFGWDSGRALRHAVTHSSAQSTTSDLSWWSLVTFQGLDSLILSVQQAIESHWLVHPACLLDFEDGLDLLDLVPLLEVVLSVNCVLCSAPVKLLWVIGNWSHARFVSPTIFQPFCVHHRVGSRVAWTMTWTLVTYVICLAHLFWFMQFLVCCPVNFAISSVDFKASNHF